MITIKRCCRCQEFSLSGKSLSDQQKKIILLINSDEFLKKEFGGIEIVMCSCKECINKLGIETMKIVQLHKNNK